VLCCATATPFWMGSNSTPFTFCSPPSSLIPSLGSTLPPSKRAIPLCTFLSDPSMTGSHWPLHLHERTTCCSTDRLYCSDYTYTCPCIMP
jgi:hypothetical protein